MPFSDELARGVVVVSYDPRWPGAFSGLAGRVKSALGSAAVRVDHIGSTSVPGLAAKDCIDLQVRVDRLDEDSVIGRFEKIGFRVRPEPWNRIEHVAGVTCPKLVFAPPPGERASNIHVRETRSATVRHNLLFRDFLSANDAARDSWGDFKQHLASSVTDLCQYGQAKIGPTAVLMIAAESWAAEAEWAVGVDVYPGASASGDNQAVP